MPDASVTLSYLKEEVRALVRRKGWGVDGVQNPQQVAMAMSVEMSELLEHFQWLTTGQAAALADGADEARVRKIAEEFADVMMYGLQLCYTLHIDVSDEILRKIAIVDHRPAGWKSGG